MLNFSFFQICIEFVLVPVLQLLFTFVCISFLYLLVGVISGQDQPPPVDRQVNFSIFGLEPFSEAIFSKQHIFEVEVLHTSFKQKQTLMG